MPMSNRVRRDEFSSQCEIVGNYALDFVRGQWRIYEQYWDYSTTSGGMVRKGKVVRRYDPDAGKQEGLPATFATKDEATAYFERWLKEKTINTQGQL